MSKIKMYCIFAQESIDKMGGNRGKLAAQAGHAFLHAWWMASEVDDDVAWDYFMTDHAYKITLVVDTVAELEKLFEKYKHVSGCTLITDAGFTVFDEPTTTCLGIGPLREEQIGDDLKELKLLV